MVIASHWVGFILPGIIDDPGSFEGIIISPIPERGPLASQRMSFAILNSDPAIVFNDPDNSTIQSWAPKASNLFSAVLNGRFVIEDISFATSSAYPLKEFIPVPTAVPPIAVSYKHLTLPTILLV